MLINPSIRAERPKVAYVQKKKKKKKKRWPTDHIVKVKVKEAEKLVRCQYFAREYKMLWSMKVIVIPIVRGEESPRTWKKDSQDHKTTKIGRDILKSSGKIIRPSIIQT